MPIYTSAIPCLMLEVVLCVVSASAQRPGPLAPSLSDLSRKAGYIFSGTVTSMRRVAPRGPYSVPTVEVTFRVEQAIRGVRAGQILTVREWAGMWDAGNRFRIAERVLLFLHSPGKLGLTSSVAGPFGRFSMNSSGDVILESARAAAFRNDPVLRLPLRRTPLHSQASVNSRTFARAVRRSLEY